MAAASMAATGGSMMIHVGFSYGGGARPSSSSSSVSAVVLRPRRRMVVKAAAEGINPEIRKTEAKVVDTVVVTELSKPLTPYCRFLIFPICLPFLHHNVD